MEVYILMLAGEPQYVTTNLQRIKNECKKWFDDHRDDPDVCDGFNFLLETSHYPKTDKGLNSAWHDYVNNEYESGTWGDYAWYVSWLD